MAQTCSPSYLEAKVGGSIYLSISLYTHTYGFSSLKCKQRKGDNFVLFFDVSQNPRKNLAYSMHSKNIWWMNEHTENEI